MCKVSPLPILPTPPQKQGSGSSNNIYLLGNQFPGICPILESSFLSMNLSPTLLTDLDPFDAANLQWVEGEFPSFFHEEKLELILLNVY